mmetsp:Transcript_61759/g.93244  ORF Transcript_61759/g.93244 Transcript_61759/m.93244 type:complete len:256 (+) Transcript_61759:579-1346(+)
MLQVLVDNERFHSARLEALHRVVHAKANLPRVLGDLVEVLLNDLLLLDELDVRQHLRRQLDRLVEAVLASVRHVDNHHHLGRQTLVKPLGIDKHVLELGGTGDDQARDVHLIVGDEHLRRHLRDLGHVVVSLLETQARETERRLPSSAVLLGELDRHFVENFARVARERAKQSAVSVHDDEPELVVALQQLLQRLNVELVVAEVEGGVDGLEGLEVDRHLPLLSVLCQHRAAVKHQPVGRHLVVQLQTLLCGGDS